MNEIVTYKSRVTGISDGSLGLINIVKNSKLTRSIPQLIHIDHSMFLRLIENVQIGDMIEVTVDQKDFANKLIDYQVNPA